MGTDTVKVSKEKRNLFTFQGQHQPFSGEKNANLNKMLCLGWVKCLKIVFKINRKAIDTMHFVWYNVVTSANGSFCCARKFAPRIFSRRNATPEGGTHGKITHVG